MYYQNCILFYSKYYLGDQNQVETEAWKTPQSYFKLIFFNILILKNKKIYRFIIFPNNKFSSQANWYTNHSTLVIWWLVQDPRWRSSHLFCPRNIGGVDAWFSSGVKLPRTSQAKQTHARPWILLKLATWIFASTLSQTPSFLKEKMARLLFDASLYSSILLVEDSLNLLLVFSFWKRWLILINV